MSNENWNTSKIKYYCLSCCKGRKDSVEYHDMNSDEYQSIDITTHPTYYFNHDTHTLKFEFHIAMKTCKSDFKQYFYKDDATLQDICDVFNRDPPLDKSIYTCSTWKNMCDDKITDNDIIGEIGGINYTIRINGQITDYYGNVKTDDFITNFLQEMYNDKLCCYRQTIRLHQSILTFPDEKYNIVEVDDEVIYMYVERYHDLHHFKNDDEEVKTLYVNEEFDEDVRREYALKDVFTLPHYIEVDGIEYVRVNVKGIESTHVFSTGDLLCDISFE